MRMLDSYRKRRAIKAFSKGLGPALSERFGRTPYYTADQIGDVVGSGKFRRYRDYLPYAFCLFMSQKDFEALGADAAPGNFETLRGEAHAFIGPGPGIASPVPGACGDPFPGPGDFDPGDGPGL